MDCSLLQQESYSKSLFPAVWGQLSYLRKGFRSVQFLDGQQIALLSRANDTLRSPLCTTVRAFLASDGGREDGLNDGGVKVHHHCLCQVDLVS